MYRFQIVPPVDNLVVPKLDKVGLIFLVSGRDEAVDLFSSVSHGAQLLGERGRRARGMRWGQREQDKGMEGYMSEKKGAGYCRERRLIPLPLI
jgi:hypothetical protein